MCGAGSVARNGPSASHAAMRTCEGRGGEGCEEGEREGVHHPERVARGGALRTQREPSS